MDPVGLSNKPIKHFGDTGKDRILTLYNWCLHEGRVPIEWNHSVISMIIKNGQSPNELSSYRPISMAWGATIQITLAKSSVLSTKNNQRILSRQDVLSKSRWRLFNH